MIDSKPSDMIPAGAMFQVKNFIVRCKNKIFWFPKKVPLIQPSRLLLLLLALASKTDYAHALPKGGSVKSGNIQIQPQKGTSQTIVQRSKLGAIDWQSFNIGAGEQVNFTQPSSDSTIVNRVIGNNPSLIYGNINSNGQVFLINPDGILFSSSSQINVGGLVASTLQLNTSSKSAAGTTYQFSGPYNGGVVQEGNISSPFVVLISQEIENLGTIKSRNGRIALLSGAEATIHTSGNSLIGVEVSGSAAPAKIKNSGTLSADAGEINIIASTHTSSTTPIIEINGVVEANTISSHHGMIYIHGGDLGDVDVTGVIKATGDVSSTQGGGISITGQHVAVRDGAQLNASGTSGGGTIHVGGSWHGEGEGKRAEQTLVEQGALISANATESGHGGEVVVWSDKKTQFGGTIEARGGEHGGNGGQVETSSHGVLIAKGTVDVGSSHGQGGNWLIDPNNITISDEADVHIKKDFTSTDDDAVVSVQSIRKGLIDGGTVTITTASAGADTQEGNIVVTAEISTNLAAGESSTLTLVAQKDIIFESTGSIFAGGSNRELNVNLFAGSEIGSALIPGFNPGMIEMKAGSRIDTGTGHVSLIGRGDITLGTMKVGGDFTIESNNGSVTQNGAITNHGSFLIQAGSGDIALNTAANQLTQFSALGQNIAINNVRGLELGAIEAENLVINTASSPGGNITQSAAAHVSGRTQIDAGFGDVKLTQADNRLGVLAASADTVQVVNAQALKLGAIQANNLLVNTAAADGWVQQSAAVVVSETTEIKAGGGNVLLTLAGNDLGRLVVNANAVEVANAQTLELGAIKTNRLRIDTSATGAAISQSAAAEVSGLTQIAAGTGDVQLTHANNLLNTVRIDSAAAVGLANTQALVLDAVQASSLSVSTARAAAGAGAEVSQTGPAVVSGLTQIDAGSASVRLTHADNQFSGLAATGNAVEVTNTSALTLGAIQANSLTVNTAATGAAIHQSDAAVVGGATVINAGSGDVQLTHADNALASFSAEGGSVAVTNAQALVLGRVRAEDLTLTIARSGAGVTQTEALVVSGAATVDAASGDVVLSHVDNRLGSLAATAKTVTVTNATALALGAIQATRLTVNTDAVGGDVSQLAQTQLAISQQTSIQTGSGDVQLTQANNQLGRVIISGYDVAVSSGQALELGSITANSLTVSTAAAAAGAGADVSQSAALAVSGLTRVDAGSANVQLTHADNQLGGLAASAGTVQVVNTQALELGAITANSLDISTAAAAAGAGAQISQTAAAAVSGSTRINAGNADVLLTQAGNQFNQVNLTGNRIDLSNNQALDLGVITANSLNISTAAADEGVGAQISQSAALQVSGNTHINAGSGAVALTHTGNQLTSFSASAGDITLVNAQALTLGSIQASSLGVSTAAVNANVSQSAAAQVSGLTQVDAGSADVLLTQADNRLGTVSAVAHAVAVTNAKALTLDAIEADSLTVNTAAAGAAITQTAAAVVSGVTQVDAGSGSVQLSHADNRLNSFSGSAASLEVQNAQALVLGAIAANSLTVDTAVAGGDVTQSAAAQVTGRTQIDAGVGAVVLTQTDNRLGVLAASADTVQVVNAQALELGAIQANNLLVNTAAANGWVQQSAAVVVSETTEIKAGGGNVLLTLAGNDLGRLVVNANAAEVANAQALELGAIKTNRLRIDTSATGAAISQSAAAEVSGLTQIAAGTGDVQLTHANNLLNTVRIDNAAAVGLANTQALVLDAVQASSLSVSTARAAAGAGAEVSQTGPAVVSGLTQIDAGSASVRLTHADNQFSGLAATGNAVEVTNTSALTLGAIQANSLTVNTAATGAAIHQSDAAVVGGATVINAGSGDVQLTHADNTLASFSAQGGAVAVANAQALVLDGVQASSLDVTITRAAAGVTQTAALVVSGATTIDAASGDVVLNHADNRLSGFGALAKTVSLTNAQSLDLGAIQTTRLTVNTEAVGGDISQSAAAAVSEQINIQTGRGDVQLTQTNNQLGRVIISGYDVAVSSGQALELGSITANSLTVSTAAAAAGAGADVSQSAALAVSGLTRVDAGSANVQLTHADNQLGGLAASAGTVQVVNAQALELGAIQATSLDISTAAAAAGAGAQISQTAAASVSGSTHIDAGSADVLLTQAGNRFNQVSLTGNRIDLSNNQALDLGSITASSLSVNTAAANANISQSAAAQISGNTQVNAGSGAVALTHTGNQLASFSASAGAITLVNAQALTLGSIQASSLDISTAAVNANVSQNAAAQVSGLTQVDAGSADVLLTQADNRLGQLAATGTHITVVNRGGVSLGNIHATDFSLTSESEAGTIDQFAALSVSGETTVQAGTGTVLLTDANNDIGSFQGAAQTLSLTSSRSVLLGTVTAANLTVDTRARDGFITQKANTTLSATQASFHAGSADITLDQNNILHGFAASGRDIQLVNTIDVTLGEIAASNLTLDTAANNATIRQNAGAQVSGLSTLNSGSGSILLTQNDNVLSRISAAGDVVAVTSQGALEINRLVANNAVLSTQPGNGNITQTQPVVVSGGLQVDAGTGNVFLNEVNTIGHFGAMGNQVELITHDTIWLDSVNVSRLTIDTSGATADGSIRQNLGSTVVVNDQALITAHGDIVLTQAGNKINGISATANAIDLVNQSDLVIYGINAENLTINTSLGNGSVSQTQAVNISGDINIQTGQGDIILNHSANNFGSQLSLGGGSVEVRTTGVLSISALSHGSNESVRLVANTLTLPAMDFSLGEGDLTIHVASGALTSTGNWSANNISLHSPDGVLLQHNISATNNLELIASHGAVEQTLGFLAVQGDTYFESGSSYVNFSSSRNTFGGSVDARGSQVLLTAASGINAHVFTTGDAQLTAGGALGVDGIVAGSLLVDSADTVTLGRLRVDQGLTINAYGEVNQTGAIQVQGDLLMQTHGHDATLTLTGNFFEGAITAETGRLALDADGNIDLALNASGNVNLNVDGDLNFSGTVGGALAVSTGAMVLGTTRVLGDLDISASKTVTQTGTLSALGIASINAGNNDIDLSLPGNRFASLLTLQGGEIKLNSAMYPLTVALVAAGDVQLSSGTGLQVSGQVGGDLLVESAGSITWGETAIAGALTATSAGNITQTQAIQVGGGITLDAGHNDIVLDQAANLLEGSALLNGKSIHVASNAAMTAEIHATQEVTLSAGAGLNVTGDAEGNFTAQAVGNLVLGDISTNGQLTAKAGGTISQNSQANLFVADSSELNAGGNITLLNTSNVLNGVTAATGNQVHLFTTGALNAIVNADSDTSLQAGGNVTVVQQIEHDPTRRGVAVGGNLQITSGGYLSQQMGSTVTVTGSAALTTSGGGDISLQETSNSFTGNMALQGGHTVLQSASSLRLSSTDVASLSVISSQELVLTGTLTASGPVSLQGATIVGEGGLGALNVAANQQVSLTATEGGIGASGAPVNNPGIIHLLGQTGTGENAFLEFIAPALQPVWFEVSSADALKSLVIKKKSNQGNEIHGCYSLTNCVAITTKIADYNAALTSLYTSYYQETANQFENLGINWGAGLRNKTITEPHKVSRKRVVRVNSDLDCPVTLTKKFGATGKFEISLNKDAVCSVKNSVGKK